MKNFLKEGDIFVEIGEKKILIEGSYLVEKTTVDGGGTGHGPGDIYPDGHHVYARRLLKGTEWNTAVQLIDFWQSGSFNRMIEPKNVKVIGKAQKTWLITELE